MCGISSSAEAGASIGEGITGGEIDTRVVWRPKTRSHTHIHIFAMDIQIKIPSKY